MDLNRQDFKFIQQFLEQSCGIVLSDTKQYLVKNRLSGLLARYGMASFADLTGALQAATSTALKIKVDVVEAMTTNETFWFRDENQFTELKETVLPDLLAKKRSAKVWSAACSSGQEPYSVSLCCEQIGNNPAVRILGTDISESVLKQARLAVYSESTLGRGIDAATRSRFFQAVDNGYRLNSEVAGRVRFQQFNLLKPFTALGRFDIILCRNVLIYFSDDIKKDILKRMLQTLEPGGVLFLSSTEVLPPGIPGFEPIRGKRCRYYRRAD
ncbi:MAG: CheR family methyltransferase [Gammaproteobacteria bacterium]